MKLPAAGTYPQTWGYRTFVDGNAVDTKTFKNYVLIYVLC